MSARVRAGLFWAALGALIVGHVVVAWDSLVNFRLWEDEAFNLTVPQNLLDGLGYASDGTLSGSQITPFDPRISTGPTVLLPVAAILTTGIDAVIGARLVPLAYWALLLVGLGILGRRIGGRWAALTAIAVPLAFTSNGVSSIQGPADLLGEIPAAALIVWALIALPQRPWVSGLLIGLAIQAKLIALLAMPAFAVALWVLGEGSGWLRIRSALRRSWPLLIFSAVPTLVFELWALSILGVDGFQKHAIDLVRFVRSGGQEAVTTALQKADTLAQAWSVPAPAAVIGAAIAATLSIAVVIRKWRSATKEERTIQAYLVAALVGAATFLGWWISAAHLPLWVRHPAPGVFSFFPLIASGAVCAVRSKTRGLWRPVSIVAIGVIAAVVSTGAALHVVAATEPHEVTLEDQREDAGTIREWVKANDIVWLAAEPWGSAVSAIVLSGARAGLYDAPAMAGIPRLTVTQCQEKVLFESALSRICKAP